MGFNMDKSFAQYQGKTLQLIAAFIFILAITVLHSLDHAAAETPEEKGLAIAVEADRRNTGFENSTADMLMILKNRHGQESRRQMRFRNLEVEGDGDKSLTIFDSPMDVKGTAFLNYTHKEGDDDQWLYLPALKRIKRISSRNKSGSFMGSEFAYEDIASQEIENTPTNGSGTRSIRAMTVSCRSATRLTGRTPVTAGRWPG